LEFDQEEHKYRVNGMDVPTVTELLKLGGAIDTRFFTASGSHRGTRRHKATELYDDGSLDWGTVHPDDYPHVLGWSNFIRDNDVEIVDSEIPGFNRFFRYAGTLDRIAIIDGKYFVVDIKTGAYAWSSLLQVELYAEILEGYARHHGVSEAKHVGGLVVHTGQGGAQGYRTIYSSPESRSGADGLLRYLAYRRSVS